MAKLPRHARPQMRPIGRTAERKSPVRRVEYAEVAKRAKGRCELCHFEWERLSGNRLSVHHTYGRGHLPGIPVAFCESRDLLLGLCNNWALTGHLGCHERVHAGDLALADKARMQALYRFTERWDLELPELMEEAGPDLVDVMRACVRRLEERTGA